MLKKSYSQLNQDLNVVSFFNSKKGLYFLDIGANDGVNLSNTYLLEKKYSWTGICSEPLPDAFKNLEEVRDVICDNNAVFSKSNLKLEFSQSNQLSGITKFIDRHTKAKEGKQIKVNTITLQDLLKKYGAPKIIHYMSLDTEGSEYEILKSVNLKEYIFLYINLEHNGVEPRRTNIRNLLENNGYIYKGPNRWDDDYIHEKTIIGKYYYDNNYDKPIEICRIDKLKFSVKSPYWDDDEGILDPINLKIKWNRLGSGEIFYDHIKYNDKNIWEKSLNKKN